LIDILHYRHRGRLFGLAGLAFLAALAAAPAFAQFSAPYDPDFAPTEQPAPQPAPEAPPTPVPEPLPSPAETAVPVLTVPTAPGRTKNVFRLIDRPDATHVLEPLASTAAAPGAGALSPSTEYSLDRFQRVRAAVDRGEEPGTEEVQNGLGPGWTAPVVGIDISTTAPKPPPPEVELPTYGTSLSVTGRKVIGFSYNEKHLIGNQATTGLAQTTDLVQITQQLQLRMQGKVGPKITVNVDYDDTKANQQDISVVYNGDPNEVVQNVQFGDIDLTLPATEFVSYNKQLFGIRADIKYKGFKATIIASRTKGTTKSKQFLGNSQFVNMDILDTAYIRRTYYDLTFGDLARLPIRTGTERIFQSQQTLLATNNVNQQTLTVDDLGTLNNPSVAVTSFTAVFTQLVAGQDYTVNYAKGFLQLRNQAQPQFVMAADYIDAAGVELINLSSTTADITTGGTGRFKLIKTSGDVYISTPSEAGYTREMKTFYSLGQTSIVGDNGRGNFLLQVLDPTTRALLGPGLTPPQVYPADITVDFANGIFQLLEPFSYSSATPLGDPNIYAPTPITERIINAEFNYRFKTFTLEPNLVVQSELVILDGQKLNRNVDYFIDYEAGFITFFNPDRILPTSQIDITYEVAAFAGATNDTLLGGRVSHDFNANASMGATLLYDAGTKSPTTPQITELARSLMVYEFDSQIKKVKIGKKLTMTLQGEFAQSRQEMNLNSYALIDNMEGILQQSAASMLSTSWFIASNPSAPVTPSDPTKILWATETDNILAINPNASAGANATQQVLDLNYDFSNPYSQEMSIVYVFSTSGIDFSHYTQLQVVMAGDNGGEQLDFHLGGINEDADGTGGMTLNCANGTVVTGAPKTEDTDCTGILTPAKDIGWCYSYTNPGTGVTNNCAARYGAANGILDSEDLNKNGHLDPADFTGGDFGYVPDPNNPTNMELFDATSGSTITAITFGGQTFHTLQIPLNISSQTASNWTAIKELRLSIKPGTLTTGTLRFASIAVIGNTWLPGLAGDLNTGLGAIANEALLVSAINNVANSNYVPIYNAGGDASTVFNELYGSVSTLQQLNNTSNISEQSLKLNFTGMTPGATVYTERVFTTAIDVSQHHQFNFLLFSNADPNNVDTTGKEVFFLRAGSDQNFFEIDVPMTWIGWKQISISQTDPGNGVANNWVSNTPNTVIISTGAPSLQTVAELVAGVYANPGIARNPAQGSLYVDEIFVAQPVTRVGSAEKLQADFDYAGWGTFGYKLRSMDANFQTPTSVVSNQSARTDNVYLNITRLSWMPVTMNATRLITDTPSTVATGDLSNLTNLLQEGSVTTWTEAAQANIAYGAYPRLNLGYTRNLIDYDLLTRQDDKQAYTGTMQYGLHTQSRWLPHTIDANYGASFYDVLYKSDLARSETGDYDTSERDNIYGGRMTFVPWTGSSFNPSFAKTVATERRTDYTSGAPIDSQYPKSLHQTMGFTSNFRFRSWFNPQISYSIDDLENNILSVSSVVVNVSTLSFNAGDVKTVTRQANGSISLPIAISDIFPKTKLFHSMNIVSGYQLQDGDVWNYVEKGYNTSDDFFVRQVLRPGDPAASEASLTLRDTWNSTQRWSPFQSYKFGGRWAPLSTLAISNNYVLSDQRSAVTGTASKTIAQTLPDAVASISQLEKMIGTSKYMANTQMDFKYSRRTTETVGATMNTINSFGTDIRSVILKKYDTSLNFNMALTTNEDLQVSANTANIRHQDASGQVTFDVKKFRLTPKLDYSFDETSLGTGIISQKLTVITPSVLARADLALPAGLRLPGSSRPLLFTNRIIWTTTLSLSHRESPVSPIDNANLASLNTSADYELAKNLRMTLNGQAQRQWSIDLPVDSFYSFTLGTTLTFQF
jgi:hypothetical protein